MRRRFPDGTALSVMGLEELRRLFPIVWRDSRSERAENCRREKKMEEAALPVSRIGRLSRFGSTSVPGLAAKPTIDILLEARPDSFVIEALRLLEKCAALQRPLQEKFEFNRDAHTEGKTELTAAMTLRRGRKCRAGTLRTGAVKRGCSF